MPEYKTVTQPRLGLVATDLDSSLIAPEASSGMQNMRLVGDYIGQKDGRDNYGSLGGTAVMKYYHFRIGTSNHFMKFTTEKIGKRSLTGWTDITGTDLTGGPTDFVDACAVYDDSGGTFYVVFTNGKDAPRKYTGSGNTAALTGWASHKVKFYRYYQGYLVGGYITTSGTAYPVRLICSHTDEPDNLTGANSRTFNLTQDQNMSDIMAIEHFNDFLAVYKTDAIYLLFLGSTTNIFEWTVPVQGIGLRASRALTIDGQGRHYFLGYDNVWMWANASSEPVPIGTDTVRNRIFDVAGPSELLKAQMVYHQEYNQIRLYVPSGTYLDNVFVYDIEDGSWFQEQPALNLTAVSTYFVDTGTTWAEASGSWGSQTDQWDTVNIESNFPLLLEGDSSGASYSLSETTYNESGATIDSYYDTVDEIYEDVNSDGVPFNQKRVMGIRFEALGPSGSDTLDIYYSTDEGVTWTQITAGIYQDETAWSGSPNLTTAWAWYEAQFDIETRNIRYRFRNPNASQSWRVRKWYTIFEETANR